MNLRIQTFALFAALTCASFAAEVNKQHSAFYPPELVAKIRANLKHDPHGKTFLKKAIDDAAYWRNLSDDELRDLCFSSHITRSWMVWSDGDCPACKKPVRMYDWKIEAQKRPWKLECPNCGEIFPKNDFYALYRSGLDEHGEYNPKKANRALLFNSDHPDPKDPLHMFGVDDGEGYVAEGHRWRFIGAYLIYGQFKQLILNGTRALATAYVLTGDEAYAHKCGVLLDRLADFYPSYDYAKQGLVYEVGGYNGYISVWHDACEETRELALSYDQIFDGFHDEAKRHNIEAGLLKHPIAHPERVYSNFPRDAMTLAVLHAVLAWPDNRQQVEASIDAFLKKATAVDGVTGEKGLSGYTSFTINSLAYFLEQYCRIDPTFLHGTIQRTPALTNTWRFHIDTYCLDQYYPRSGDCSAFAQSTPHYVGSIFDKTQANPLLPSAYSFFWRLYEETHDPAYVQILYRENDHSIKDLPHDLSADDRAKFQKAVKQVIAKVGEEIKLGSINKQAWHIAILRSGQGKNARALWLDYDSWGNHSHLDGMTLGLFAHGLDLLPDFGYPPVQFGGWSTPRAQWYMTTAAHNTVLVDKNQVQAAGKTTLWADSEMFHAIRADAPAMVGGQKYERTAALIDVSEKDFYVLDIFRTVAGSGHYKFTYGPIATLSTNKLNLQPSSRPLISGGELRNFAIATNPPIGWSIDWNIADRFHQLPKNTNLKMRYTDLSEGVDAITAEAWIAPPVHLADNLGEAWIATLITRKVGAAPLNSTFVSVLEPFEHDSCIARIQRLPLTVRKDQAHWSGASDPDVALQIDLKSGSRDLLICPRTNDSTNSTDAFQSTWYVQFNGSLCWIRTEKFGRIQHLVAVGGSRLRWHRTELQMSKDLTEIEWDGNHARVLRGDVKDIHLTHTQSEGSVESVSLNLAPKFRIRPPEF